VRNEVDYAEGDARNVRLPWVVIGVGEFGDLL